MVNGDGVRTATVGHDVFTSPLLTSILVKMSGQRPSRPRERLYKFCGFISNVLRRRKGREDHPVVLSFLFNISDFKTAVGLTALTIC